MTHVLPIDIKRDRESVVIPAYAYPGDAGMDLRSAQALTLQPFERALVPTGLYVAIPEGYAGLVLPRSGLAIKHGISIVNAPGLIDSHYRGELKVALINLDPTTPFEIAEGDRIAQLVVQKVETVQWNVVVSLDETERGSGGFGSSGVE